MKIRIKSQKEIFSHEVTGDTVTIGRSSENDFVIPLEDFSRKHCQITFSNNYAFIMDLGSKNGVIIDGKRIKPHEQHPIYDTSKVILANYFEFTLPNGTFIKQLDPPLPLTLEEIVERRRK
jgi:pSer/pThr/pTyr-binding forkhead associated (FHA) protein